jgi:hypothetical protein
MARPSNPAIPEFILRNIPGHETDIGSLTAKTFNISRTAVSNHIRKLIKDGFVEAIGNTNARSYKLKNLKETYFTIQITKDVQEDIVWHERIFPLVQSLKNNVVEICEYGFNEMINNVVDHSESKTCDIFYKHNYAEVKIQIRDYGIGIFEKIRKAYNLVDRRQALLEVAKGKLTTDRERHTGEGIFFTSQMFDRYYIISNDLYYRRTRQDDEDWLIESGPGTEDTQGTFIRMCISTNASQTAKEVFAKYVDDEYRFSRTHVPLKLAKYEGEKLVSRSQAKRLLARVDRFSEVILDFKGISEIGQPFADQIFRIFQRDHPSITIIPVFTNPDIDKMINHAKANAEADVASSEEPQLPF